MGRIDPPVWQGANLNFIQIEHHNSSDKSMEPIEILKEFNSCYQKIQAIAQDENWLLLIAEKKIDPEAATHLGDVLHYLDQAMGCVEKVVEIKFNQETKS
ncbi:hypothetical protein [Nostoc sp. LEGE 12450]|uniref:hypothetical protein n=1 Tax=Nostoc sp. LEGE 12450 TaxID=1828643 RepID=UPI00187EA00D|nr:hypothetical protein [Nostoc sp. LEGE 12450]MBE8990471.1 hypothetical protein [Nostoc sp. LEGE 12450]